MKVPKKSADAQKWEAILNYMTERFSPEDTITIEGIVFLVGIQVLGQGTRTYKKDEKLHIMHIAVCHLLEPWGYYHYQGRDQQGWPHYKTSDTLPSLKSGEQSILIKKSLIRFFDRETLLHKDFREIETQEQIA